MRSADGLGVPLFSGFWSKDEICMLRRRGDDKVPFALYCRRLSTAFTMTRPCVTCFSRPRHQEVMVKLSTSSREEKSPHHAADGCEAHDHRAS
jgi:NADH:ubiquinone oxidoreductase subunit 5 (subunit L)/multisubunit Na+/H+ antiporter MnhA subunit